jgi:hypothetical protein
MSRHRAATHFSTVPILEVAQLETVSRKQPPANRSSVPRFRVRDTPDRRQHAADVEAEMLGRGMNFEIIDWLEGQATLPVEGLADRIHKRTGALNEGGRQPRRPQFLRENWPLLHHALDGVGAELRQFVSERQEFFKGR